MAITGKDQWSVEIKPAHGWLNLNLKELWRYRDLIYLLARRNFVSLYKQTILGPAWAIIQPLLTTVIFTVVFGKIANISTDGMPQFLFYMAGNVPWTYFARCLEKTSETFLANEKIFGKVYFPRLCAPIATVLFTMVSFLIQFALFLIFLAFYALQPNPVVHLNWPLVALMPVVLLEMGLLGLGVGIMISALTVRYRDLALLVSFGVQLWMYASPVAYPASLMMQNYPALAGVYMLNPMAPIIEYFRAAFLGTDTFSLGYLILSMGMTALILFAGAILFNRSQKTFMDNI
ncbi:MAG: ABC transporter permease [Clostridia bacterium]|nr:ABC transporter permease [Clostridia bacterium]MBQ4619578.1 ABC transporter permease [Clostridia bacterium]